ncbi:MAG: four helix bundle protein [Nanoarchaeota archaeon]|nr:four helix bundle protein [Nanoarchaeota archaeon]MBU1135510.1 four helix bundle protein [Nanoarchaeota archaeon]MBU2520300.1 four helix bundle protein [Nanoarchaeota archaeon]
MQNPEKLEVYKESYALSKDVLLELEGVKGKFRLKEQLFGAVSAIPANLMEFGSMENKNQQAQKIRVCIGEAYEAQYWFDLCRDVGILSEEKHKDFINRVKVVRMKLFNLLKAVKSEM